MHFSTLCNKYVMKCSRGDESFGTVPQTDTCECHSIFRASNRIFDWDVKETLLNCSLWSAAAKASGAGVVHGQIWVKGGKIIPLLCNLTSDWIRRDPLSYSWESQLRGVSYPNANFAILSNDHEIDIDVSLIKIYIHLLKKGLPEFSIWIRMLDVVTKIMCNLVEENLLIYFLFNIPTYSLSVEKQGPDLPSATHQPMNWLIISPD